MGRAHRQRYYDLARSLHLEDLRNPHQTRAIAFRELPNLLHAVHASLEEDDPEAVDFAGRLTWFLSFFSLPRDIAALGARSQAAAREVGSASWFLAQSNRGEQLVAARRVQEAADVFQEVLNQLEEAPSYERALTLSRLGRCYADGGRPDLAERASRHALAVLDQLEPSDEVKRQQGNLLTDLADVLTDQGRYAEARKAYQEGLRVLKDQGDLRGQGISLVELGTLAMLEGDLEEAVECHRSALALFQELQEPATEAVVWHQLGVTFQLARQWAEAERHYREAARIEEELGGMAGAARTWNLLATVNQQAGKLAAAETWYRKAIEGSRQTGDASTTAPALNNLAVLLHSQPERLAEAQRLAEEALAIEKTLDPGASSIWKTYSILAIIADQEGQSTQANEYRHLAREAKRNFAGTRHELRRRAPLILAVFAACGGQEEARQAVSQKQAAMREAGERWSRVADTLDRILAGERDAEALCERLDFECSMIVETILGGIEDPSSLQDLLPAEE